MRRSVASPDKVKKRVGKSCCRAMSLAVRRTCPDHPNRYDCPDCLVAFDERSERYGLIIHDGGTSAVGIRYCPWCGRRLGTARRRRRPVSPVSPGSCRLEPAR